MFKLSIFNRDQLVQLLSALVDYSTREDVIEKIRPQERELLTTFIGKLEEQAQSHAGSFTVKNYCKMFSFMAK